MKKTALIVVIGLVVGVGVYLLATHSNTPTSLNSDLYPLYSGVTWSGVKAATADNAVGYEVVSNPITGITDIAASSTPFTDYYRQKLSQLGWTQDMNREAGGPGAETSVYTKGNEFIIVSFSSLFHNKPADAPEQCPCDLTFTLVSGSVK